MILEIIISLIAFLLFAYVFIFKLVKKNDTTYLTILIMQAAGILLNFIQIIFNILTGILFKIIVWTVCIIIPIALFIVEYKGINVSEFVSITIAKIFMFFGRTKKVKDILTKLVSKYDKSYSAHKMLAEIYENEGGMRKAIDEYIKVLDIRGDDYKSYFKISKLLNDLGKKDEAIEMLQILVRKRPELSEASKMLGDLQMEKGRFKQAANAYAQAVKNDEDNAELYYDLGIAYSRINEFPLAKQCFEKVVEVDSNFYNAYYRLGQIALLYRDTEGAEQYFLQSIYGEVEEKSYYKLAKIYMIKNNRSKAAMFLNRAIDINPNKYNELISEPIFLPIKQQIEKPQETEKEVPQESEKEKEISEYLDNTYDLTRVLKDKKNKNKKN